MAPFKIKNKTFSSSLRQIAKFYFSPRSPLPLLIQSLFPAQKEVAPPQCRRRKTSEEFPHRHLHVMFVSYSDINSLSSLSAGDPAPPERCDPPEAAAPAPPPSFPLILDKDPVPEELVGTICDQTFYATFYLNMSPPPNHHV